VAFKPFKVHTVPLNDVTTAYHAGKLFNLVENIEFSDYSERGHTSYPDGTQVDWSKHYEPKKDKTSSLSTDDIENVLNKY